MSDRQPLLGKENNGTTSERRLESSEFHVHSLELQGVPPDGGFSAVLVVFCVSVCRGVIFGIHQSFGIIYIHLNELHNQDQHSAMKVSLVGSLGFGALFFLSPLSGILSHKLGLRPIAFIGSVMAAFGMLASSIYVDNLTMLYCTYGLFGAGCSLLYTPSMAILGHYFKKHIGLANGLVQAGGCIFSIFMPSLLTFLFGKINVANTFRVLSGLIATLMLCVLSYKPVLKVTKAESNGKSLISEVIYVDNFKNYKYMIWAFSVSVAALGKFVPFHYLIDYAAKNEIHGASGDVLLICIALCSSISRLLYGKISDLEGISPILLGQLSHGALGISIMTFSSIAYVDQYRFNALITCSLVFGLCDGCYHTMIVPTAIKLCGPIGVTQGIAFMFGLMSIPVTAGPPIAGLIYEKTQSYATCFLIAGISPIMSALLMSFIYMVKGGAKEEQTNSVLDENYLSLQSIP